MGQFESSITSVCGADMEVALEDVRGSVTVVVAVAVLVPKLVATLVATLVTTLVETTVLVDAAGVGLVA
jgi:hypothetical protein